MASSHKKQRRETDPKELPPKRGPGRPRTEIDWVEFDKLCAIHCTLQDIAWIINHDLNTIETCCERDHKMSFRAYFRRKSAGGRASLRRIQAEVAMGRDAVYDHRNNCVQQALKPNPDMLKWLGRQWLKQTDEGMPDPDEELSPYDDDGA